MFPKETVQKSPISALLTCLLLWKQSDRSEPNSNNLDTTRAFPSISCFVENTFYRHELGDLSFTVRFISVSPVTPSEDFKQVFHFIFTEISRPHHPFPKGSHCCQKPKLLRATQIGKNKFCAPSKKRSVSQSPIISGSLSGRWVILTPCCGYGTTYSLVASTVSQS